MKKILHIGLLFLFVLALASSFSACHRGPSCPAYNGIDPGRNNMNNPNSEARKTGNNKADVEKKKREELSGKNSKKGQSNLFPKYMR